MLDPANRPYLYEYDALAGRLLRAGTPLGGQRAEDLPGSPPRTPPATTADLHQARPERPGVLHHHPGRLGWSGLRPSSHAEGMAVRAYSYDERRIQTRSPTRTATRWR